MNALVGNAGYVAATGHAPTAATPDDARVLAHLAYAERLLRQRPAADSALARRRAQVLDLLHRYWATGVFPRNHKYVAERRPCFIDRDGRLCAVGYLVAETVGWAVAERINAAHQYDLIADMRLPALADWVRASGLTMQECALIQPSYGPTPSSPPTSEPLTDGYAVGSAAWGGLNIALGAINASQLNLARPDRGPVYLGVLSGAGQILFGALHLPKDEPGGNYIGWNPPAVKSYASERTVSYLNIGAGTATLGLSAWNLLRRQPAGASRTAVGVVNFPGPAGGTGLALTRRF